MAETSFAQQLLMNNMEMNSQIMQGTFSVISSLSKVQKNSSNNIPNLTVTSSMGGLAYSVDGDSKYKKEIDTDNNGIITYNEYVKYITENRLSQLNIPKSNTTFSFGEDSKTGLLKFSVTNFGKILNAYLNNNASNIHSGLILKEA